MLEPKTCKYLLTIESASLCEIINGPIDEYGIFLTKPPSSNKSDEKKSSKTLFEETVEQYFDKHVQSKDTTPLVEEETEVSKDKKEMGKLEL